MGREILEDLRSENKKARVSASETGAAASPHVDVAMKILTGRVMAELPDYKVHAQKLVSTEPATADKVSEEVEREKRAAKNRPKKENKRASKDLEKATAEQTLRDAECSAAEMETEK